MKERNKCDIEEYLWLQISLFFYTGIVFKVNLSMSAHCCCSFHICYCCILGTIIFFGREAQIYKKSASIKLRPPYFGNKKFMTPHHWYTLPLKQAKVVLKSVFLNKINTLSVVILWLPTFWSWKIVWPLIYFSFQKFVAPSIIGPEPSKENDSPLLWMYFTLGSASSVALKGYYKKEEFERSIKRLSLNMHCVDDISHFSEEF